MNREHARQSSASSHRLMHEALAFQSNFMSTEVFICCFVCSCVSWVYFKSPKLRLETLRVSVTHSEKFDIHQETQKHIFSVLGRIWAGVLLYRASPHRAFEASKLGHPACDSGISSNTN